MFLDAQEVTADLRADVCIVGAGAAGIPLALQLGKKHRVVLLESGGFEYEPETQDLYAGRQTGIRTDELVQARLRYLGGTTGHWGGWVRPMDKLDFEARDWVPHSGWPIARSDLNPYYDRAHHVCRVKDRKYDPEHWTPPKLRRQGVVLEDPTFHNVVFHTGTGPLRFGTYYREALEKSERIQAVLHANAVDLDTDPEARHVTGIQVSTLGKRRFRVAARHHVLALGTVENARLLLHSDRVQKEGLGNGRDLVGRFFLQHPAIKKLIFQAPFPTHMSVGRTGLRRDVKITTGLRPEAARRHLLLNHHFLVHRNEVDDELPLAPEIRQLMVAMGEAKAAHPAGWGLMFLEERPEQAPNPDSRVTLDDERDALGMRRVVLDWRLTELDLHTLHEVQRLFLESFRGRGRLYGWNEGYDPTRVRRRFVHGGYHHYGTTRMHDDPARGVVDARCRVHGIDNLHVAGGSVFPTTGYANPTLTIVALALRLADELERLLDS